MAVSGTFLDMRGHTSLPLPSVPFLVMSHTLILPEWGSQPGEAMLPSFAELGPQSLGFHGIRILPPAPVTALYIVLVYLTFPAVPELLGGRGYPAHMPSPLFFPALLST